MGSFSPRTVRYTHDTDPLASRRKLSFSVSEGVVPHIVALSDHAPLETAVQPQLGAHMDSFLSYLLFWQDTVEHCPSAEVNDTLLDHFQILFLQQLL